MLRTGRFTVRRLRSAFFLFRTSIRGADILVAGVFAALSLGLGAYLLARAQAAAHLSRSRNTRSGCSRPSPRCSKLRRRT